MGQHRLAFFGQGTVPSVRIMAFGLKMMDTFTLPRRKSRELKPRMSANAEGVALPEEDVYLLFASVA